jgi:hypothetical protein
MLDKFKAGSFIILLILLIFLFIESAFGILIQLARNANPRGLKNNWNALIVGLSYLILVGSLSSYAVSVAYLFLCYSGFRFTRVLHAQVFEQSPEIDATLRSASCRTPITSCISDTRSVLPFWNV